MNADALSCLMVTMPMLSNEANPSAAVVSELKIAANLIEIDRHMQTLCYIAKENIHDYNVRQTEVSTFAHGLRLNFPI